MRKKMKVMLSIFLTVAMMLGEMPKATYAMEEFDEVVEETTQVAQEAEEEVIVQEEITPEEPVEEVVEEEQPQEELQEEDVTSEEEIEDESEEVTEEEPAEKKTVFDYTDAEKKVTATLANPDILPEGAILVVDELTPSENATTEDLINDQMEEEEELVSFKAYDVHFEVDGEEVEPEDGMVTVKFSFNNGIPGVSEKDDNEVQMIHIKDSGEVENIDVNTKTDANGTVETAEFAVSEFSTFVYAEVSAVQPTAPLNTNSLGGIFSNMTAVSFGDTTFKTHNMGGVLVKGTFTGSSDGFMDDPSITMPSYAGKLGTDVKANGRNNVSNATLYVGDYNGKTVSGNVTHSQNSNYVDWDSLYSSITSEMASLQASATTTITATSNDVTLPAGGNVILDMNGNSNIMLKLSGSGDLMQQLQAGCIITILDSGTVHLPLFSQNAPYNYPHGEQNDGMGVVFVCPNADRIIIDNYGAAIGHVLAPQADIEKSGWGDYNGCLVGRNVNVDHNEGHVRTYKGTNGTINGELPLPTPTVDRGNVNFTKTFSYTEGTKELTDEQKNNIYFVISGPTEYTGNKDKSTEVTISGNKFDVTTVSDRICALTLTIPYSELTNGMINLKGLPVGTYSIKEENAEVDGYSLESTIPNRFSITKDKTTTVNVQNNYTKAEGSLKIVKNFTGATLTDAQKNKISFTISGPDNYSKTVSYSEFTNESYYTISGLKPGNYTIEENGAKLTGYDWSMEVSIDKTKDGQALVEAENTTTAIYTNDYTQHCGNLEIIKTFSGIDVGTLTDDQKSAIQFTVTGPNNYSKTVSYSDFRDGKYTVKNLPVGKYTVAETGLPSIDNMQATVTINDTETTSATITVNNNSTATAGIVNTYDKDDTSKRITISKVDVGGNEIGGAEIKITDNNGNTVEEWTSKEGKNHDIEVIPGEYTFKEVNAPKGYKTVTDIRFTVDIEGNVTVTSTDTEAAEVDNDGKLVITDEQLHFIVNKTDVTGEEELGEAVIEIYEADENGDKTGDKLDSWTSVKGENHDFGPFLEIGKSYVLEETTAPEGYTAIAATVFSVGEDGSITTGLTKSKVTDEEGNSIYLVKNELTDRKVKFSKTDIDGNELAGASITVTGTDAAGKEHSESWVSDGTAKELELPMGTYTMTETAAPEGYQIATAIEFTVNADGTITVGEMTTESEAENVIVMVDKVIPTVTISKVNVGGNEIEGAEIEITDKDGNTVDKWTSKEGESHDITVKPGEYTFKEVNAPEGYEAVTEIKFKVDKDGKVTVTNTETNAAKVDEDGKLVITDELTDRKVKFSKTDIAGKELEGATITVTGTDAAGKKVEETWVSDGKNAKELELPMGTYKMTETAAPKGYQIATAIEFTVNADGTITVGEMTTESEAENVIVMVDKVIPTVTISKVNVGGEEIGGAEIEITDKDGNKVAEWTSEEGKSHDITVKPGEYTFKEVNAPEGYEAVTEIKFTVDKDGNVTVTSTDTNAAEVDENGKLVITDELTDRKVKFSKTDIAGKELKGATITVTGTNAAGQKIEPIEWVSDGKNAKELELPMGTYTMTETTAPNGYEIATAIDFKVNANGTITVGKITTESEDKNIVTMVDGYADQTVKISKVDAGGNEIEGAEIEITDEDGNTVDKWTSKEGKSHDITVKPGEYTFKEVNAPEGYEAVTEIKFTVDKDGKVTVKDTETNAAKVDEKTGKLVITDELTDRKVKFSKTDIAGKELAGATIVVTGTDAAGQKVEKTWVSDGKAHELELPMGTYKMTETAAPNGYVIATAIDFKVNANGTITVGKTTTESEDKNIVTMVDDYADQTVTISKVGLGGKEIAGAEITVTGTNVYGDTIEPISWTSEEGKSHEITVKPGTYTFHEENAPDGYAVVTDITFTVDKDGKVTVTSTDTNAAKVDEDGKLVVTDELTSVEISKVDIAGGNEVAGAHIQILDEEGKVVKEWISTESSHKVVGLTTGKTYTLRETVAPDGYAVTTDTTFVLEADGNIDKDKTTTTIKNGVLLVEDKLTEVKISKVDITNGKELEGAQMQILDKDGKLVTKWVSTKDVHVVKGLKTGEPYTLREKVAPKGYEITSDTTFELNADGTINTEKTTTKVKDGILLVEDSRTPTKPGTSTGADNGMKFYSTQAIVAMAGATLVSILKRKNEE